MLLPPLPWGQYPVGRRRRPRPDDNDVATRPWHSPPGRP